MRAAVVLAFVLGASSAFAVGGEQGASGLASGVVKLAANMNEMALACKHMSLQEVAAAKEKQRAATIKDMEISAADYEKLDAAAVAEFRKKWAAAPAQQQKQACDQLLARSKGQR